MRPLREFLDSKFFGAAFTGVTAVATTYIAGVTGWSLIILPLLAIAAYHLCFHTPAGPLVPLRH